MPDVDGRDLLRFVREDENLRSVPVVSTWPAPRVARASAHTARLVSAARAARCGGFCTPGSSGPACAQGQALGGDVMALPPLLPRFAVMSASERSESIFECIKGGAEDYLLKPLKPKEVEYIWQHVWRRQHSAGTVPRLGDDEVRALATGARKRA